VPRQPGSGPLLSEIMLIHLNLTISAHWNEFTQNRCFFAISLNTGGSKYFPRKCGGFLELTLQHDWGIDHGTTTINCYSSNDLDIITN
jgi:hypothetical protein